MVQEGLSFHSLKVCSSSSLIYRLATAKFNILIVAQAKEINISIFKIFFRNSKPI
jgi:hypothetical protein